MQPDDDRYTTLKVPPHSTEVEQAVIGAVLLKPDILVDIDLEASEFYRREHRIIWQALLDMQAARKGIDALMLSEELSIQQKLDEAGGIGYIASFVENIHSAHNASRYATVVREKSIKRKLISAAHTIADQGYNSAEPIQDLVNGAQKMLAELNVTGKDESAHINLSIKRTLAEIERRYESKEEITGLSTGLKDLDAKTSGMQNSDLIIIAGRPSMGKSALAFNIVEHAALTQDKPILVFSLEMPTDSITTRMLSSIGKINQSRLRNGRLQNDDWDKLSMAVAKLRNRPLFIRDTPGIGPHEMRSEARQIQREHGDLALIVVDYMQLMQLKARTGNREGEISEISRTLKLIAREFNCPVVALSQLNRGLEQRSNKRPMMSDLRESGAIEQDADVIMFVYRHEVYEPDNDQYKGMAEIIIGKQRNGPIGTAHLSFRADITRFSDLAFIPKGNAPTQKEWNETDD